MNKILLASIAAAMLLMTPVQALAPDHRDAAIRGADHLLDLQFEDGAFPWNVESPGAFQNVQGLTAYALLDAYRLTLDEKYLGDATSGAEGNRNWLADYMAADEDAYVSSANVFFLADYALTTGQTDDMDLARDALDRGVEGFGGTGTAVVENLLDARAGQGHTNLGIWDAALFVRAAQDVGDAALADEMAATLADQTIVDPFDDTARWYEMGLAGLLFGLAESDAAAHADTLLNARDALLLKQCGDGSFSSTSGGEASCGDVQATAYAVIGLAMVADVVNIQDACDFLVEAQGEDGGWDLGGYEIAEMDSEAVMALSLCTLPANNAATSYADPVRDLL